MSSLLYSVSYTKFKHVRIITYKDSFMKVKNCISLSSEMCINTKLKNTLMNNAKSNILTQSLLLITVDWDEIDLLFTEMFQKIHWDHYEQY